MTTTKHKVYVYFSTYGSHKHDVLVVQEGGEPYDTMRGYHKMLDPHQSDFGRTFHQVMAKYLNEQHEVVFLETPNNN